MLPSPVVIFHYIHTPSRTNNLKLFFAITKRKTHHFRDTTQRLANLNFFVRDGVFNFWRETIFKESFVNSCVKIVVRGNSVQIVPNFPAKSLSIYTIKDS